jgi:ATP-dependent RNA helicase SUPV3L1/SUV3
LIDNTTESIEVKTTHPSLVVIDVLAKEGVTLRKGGARKIADLAGSDLSPKNILRLASELLGDVNAQQSGTRYARALDRQARRLAEKRSLEHSLSKAAFYAGVREVLSRSVYEGLVWPSTAFQALSGGFLEESGARPPLSQGVLRKHPEWLVLRDRTREDLTAALMAVKLPPGPEGLAAWIATIEASSLSGEDPAGFLPLYEETLRKFEGVAQRLQPLSRMSALELILGGLGLRPREIQPLLRQWKKVSLSAKHVKTEQARILREWERSLLNTSQVITRYGLRPVEVQRWTEQGVLPVAQYVEFHKWGKDLTAAKYDPVVLDELRSHFVAWREKEAADARHHRSLAAKASSSRRLRTSRIKQAFAHFRDLQAESGIKIWTDKSHQDVYVQVPFKQKFVVWPNSEVIVESEGAPASGSIEVSFNVVETLPLKRWLGRVDWLQLEKADQPFEDLAPILLELQHNTQQELHAAFYEVIKQYTSKLQGPVLETVVSKLGVQRLEHVQRSARQGLSTSKQIIRQLRRVFEELAKNYSQEQRAYLLKEATGLGNYIGFFPAARAMRRRFLFLAGPTNSGKSWRGFEALSRASTGVYLAPLRLLALEGQESLEGRGVPCHLVTGEERVIRENAKHTASTIEMLDTETPVDVAMIDEVQLITDPDRGWAWTQACVGVPAPLVILTGSPEVLPIVERIVALTGDSLEVQYLERLQPLHRLAGSVKMGELEKGDALIAFSRRDVLSLREELQGMGRSVAVVYGALGPEVRRSEAARFRSGEAEILVATDAVGMGLNLPIRRILFSTLLKFDGRIERKLSPAEVKQISGRAGRYGRHEEGFVGVLEGASGQDLAAGLSTPNPSPALRRFWVQPPWSAVLAVSEELGTRKLLPVLEEINHRILREDHTWQGALTDDGYSLVGMVDRVSLSLRDRFRYLGTPLDFKSPAAESQFMAWLKAHAASAKVRAPTLAFSETDQFAPELGTLEASAKLLTAYNWLALRWPDTYCEESLARERLRDTNAKLAATLKAKSKKRPPPRREWEDEEDLDWNYMPHVSGRRRRARA